MSNSETDLWRYDRDLGDGRQGWLATVGPFALAVYEDAGGSITWAVSGPDHLGDDADAEGTASTHEEARRRARREVWMRWQVVKMMLEDLEGEESPSTSKQEIRGLFHRLWTRDRHGGEYVKREWQRLGELLADRGVDV